VLKTLAFTNPVEMIESFIRVWLKKDHLCNLELIPSLTKLIEMIQCINLPTHVVLGSIVKFIEKVELDVKKEPSKKKKTLEFSECQEQSLLC
jgi:hypothetical protein